MSGVDLMFSADVVVRRFARYVACGAVKAAIILPHAELGFVGAACDRFGGRR